MKTILNRAGFNKRSGTPMSDVMFSLYALVVVAEESIACLRGNACRLHG